MLNLFYLSWTFTCDLGNCCFCCFPEDKEVLEDAKRTSDTNSNQISKINLLENLGIKVKAMYILGLPKDTKETFQKTIKYASKLCSSYAQFSVFTPYPGTPAFKDYKDIITKTKFENFNQWQLVFKHPNFTEGDIRNLLAHSYRAYYLNFKCLLVVLNVYKKCLSNLFFKI